MLRPLRPRVLRDVSRIDLSTTVLGDTDMTSMRGYFVKPQATVTMGFSGDPMMGLVSDRFTGSATATLATQAFVLRTASLR